MRVAWHDGQVACPINVTLQTLMHNLARATASILHHTQQEVHGRIVVGFCHAVVLAVI